MARATSRRSRTNLRQTWYRGAALHESRATDAENGQRSRADARSIGPSSLPSTVLYCCDTEHLLPPISASYRSWRARPVPATAETRPKRGRTTLSRVVTASRHASSAAGGVVALHRALDGAILLIKGARTYAHATITGSVAIFRAFQPEGLTQPGARCASRSPPGAALEILIACTIWLLQQLYIFFSLDQLTFIRRLAHRQPYMYYRSPRIRRRFEYRYRYR